jgi:hypothetical protein
VQAWNTFESNIFKADPWGEMSRRRFREFRLGTKTSREGSYDKGFRRFERFIQKHKGETVPMEDDLNDTQQACACMCVSVFLQDLTKLCQSPGTALCYVERRGYM